MFDAEIQEVIDGVIDVAIEVLQHPSEGVVVLSGAGTRFVNNPHPFASLLLPLPPLLNHSPPLSTVDAWPSSLPANSTA